MCHRLANGMAFKSLFPMARNSTDLGIRFLFTSLADLSPLEPKLQPLDTSYMNAWQIHQYGDIKNVVLGEGTKIPAIRKPTDILVKIFATSVNVIDVRMLGGYGSTSLNCLRKIEYGSTYSMEFPLTLGRDFSGIVVESGPSVSEFKPGDEVWGATWPHRQGTHAEYCVVPENAITKKPSNLSHVEAASIPYAALTAWGALCVTGELREKTVCSKRVLVTGGSGGVGSLAIQLLKAWGAEVTATCSTDAVPLVMSLGTDTVIDYKTMDTAHELGASGKYDIILDCVPQQTDTLLPHLKQWLGSQYITITPPLLKNLDVYGVPLGIFTAAGNLGNDLLKGMKNGSRYKWGFFVSSQTGLKLFKDLVEKNKITPVIDEVFQFDQLPNAYSKVQEGHARGKTVIRAACE